MARESGHLAFGRIRSGVVAPGRRETAVERVTEGVCVGGGRCHGGRMAAHTSNSFLRMGVRGTLTS